MKSLKNFSSLTNENLARKVYKLDIDSDSLFFINGFINHNFFFEGLSPFRKSALEEEFINSELLHSINHKFGGLDGLKRRIISEALLMNENG
jgi:superoxide dismutase